MSDDTRNPDVRTFEEAFNDNTDELDDDARPVIDIGDAQESELVDAAWQALYRYNRRKRLFQGPAGLSILRRQLDSWEIESLNQHGVGLLLGRAARWVAVGKGGHSYAKNIPGWLPGRLLADQPDEIEVPVLRTVTRVPFLNRKGDIVQTPGYHRDEETWYEPSNDLRAVELPEVISDQDVAWARGLICNELLHDFPFATPGDKANAVALLLTMFCRERYRWTPLFLVEAPTERTGKGLLVLAMLKISGQADTHLSEGIDNAEMHRTLLSALIAGQTILKFDNITDLSQEVLASVITAEHISGRLIRSSTLARAPNRAIIIATGNNPSTSREIGKRACRIRLVSDEEDPGQRTGFLWDPLLDEVHVRRGSLVRAALTILKRWVQAGEPKDESQAFSVFTPWAKELGGMLLASGIEGFSANLVGADELMGDDDWATFVHLWADLQKTTSSGIVSMEALLGLVLVHCLFPEVLGARTEPLQRKALGSVLWRKRDRVTAGYRVERKRIHGGRVYWLSKVGGE